MPATALTQLEGGFATVSVTAAAVPAYTRVKLNASGLCLALAAGTDASIGVTQVAAAASDTGVRIKLVRSEGTQIGRADVAIAVGDAIYQAAAGRVSNVAVGTQIGVAKSAAAAQDNLFEYFCI